MKKKMRITFNSPLVLWFMLACSAAALLGALTGGTSTLLLFSTRSAPLSDPLMYLRLFTHVLGHSGLDHLMGNMAMILLLGPALEEKYGWKTLLTPRFTMNSSAAPVFLRRLRAPAAFLSSIQG